MLCKDIHYQENGQTLIGKLIASDNNLAKPLVLLAPAFEGRNPLSIENGKKLAAQGYVVFVMDIYGDAKFAEGVENSMKLMMPYAEDRAFLRRRVVAAYEAATSLENVSASNIAGVGFCFGARCIFDLARAGKKLDAIISFHGSFDAPNDLENHPITASTLVLHGNQDPMTKPETIKLLEDELAVSNTPWQLNLYSEAMHAFTDPAATEVEIGRKYDAQVTTRAWRAMLNFLEDTFSK